MKILFICDGNVARSQEAELFVNSLSDGQHQATSAGINPRIGKPIDPLVIQVMNEIGYSMNGNVRKLFNEGMASDVDVVVSFVSASELPGFIRNISDVRYWDVQDPKGESLDFHRKTRDLIKSKVESLLAEI